MGILRVIGAWAKPKREKNTNSTEGQRHLAAQNWEQAETHLNAALKENRSTRVGSELLAQLSKAQLQQKKFDQAAETARAGVALAAKDPSLLWGALDNLVSVQLSQGDTEAALETLESMERSEKTRKTPDASRLLQSSRQRGGLLLGSGRLAEAQTALEESLKLTEQTHGPEHPETASLLTEIGSLYRQSGSHPQAQLHLQRALTIHRGAPEVNLAQTSESLRTLVLSLEECGDLQKATAEYERFVSVCERQIGSNGKELLNAQIRLSALYVQTGRSSAARELLGPAIHMLERHRGEALQDALAIMAEAEEQAGRPREAAACRAKVERLGAARDLVSPPAP
jgi:tetratricopeptide (TPR) repeat protein